MPAQTPLSAYSLSTPLEQSRGANCVATANMLGGCRPNPNGPSTRPRCQQAPLAPSARLLPEREREIQSQIESHLITSSLGLQLSRGWRVWGPCYLCEWSSWSVVNWNLIYLSLFLAHEHLNSRLGFILPSRSWEKRWKELHLHFFKRFSPANCLFPSHPIHTFIDLFVGCGHASWLVVL